MSAAVGDRVRWQDRWAGMPFASESTVIAVSRQSVRVLAKDGALWLPPGYYRRVRHTALVAQPTGAKR